ncbi:MmgE/PrpD family protein [Paraburkholderia fynbosensis]|uniref:2-methylcitrate dehydratase n=1 Tax=Paraburkholderia fynbosensis TaxID=1200993 RepID=A0A6J5H2Y3_9BURK|nr:MmgE/PrpD family protein [Paraburkholderia fynbosensis]CAB3809720.1 hypothetical protein LMG27177_06887 [Paraburkholderia fynbosensis]
MDDLHESKALSNRGRRAFIGGSVGIAAMALWGSSSLAQGSSATVAPASAASPNLAAQLANYAMGLRFEDLPSSVVEAAKLHFADAIGCAIPAIDEATVKQCRSVVLAEGSKGKATIFGVRGGTSPDLAAFANGVALRYYDLNDVYVGLSTAHPSDNIAAVYAAAEATNASGAEFLCNMVLSYEVNCRFLDAVNLDTLGWDSTVPSLPAAALSCGRLFGLSRAQLEQAVNISLNDHIALHQTRVQTLSDWKGIADAEAARNALFAVQLAQHGITGPAPIFEGKFGLEKQVTGPINVSLSDWGGRDRPFKISQCSMKPYPAQVTTLTAIAAAQELRGQVGAVDQVSAITIVTSKNGLTSAGTGSEKWAPRTKETADHSLPYVVARTFLDGQINNGSYTKDKLSDPKVLALMQKIKVQEDPAFTAMAPGALPTRIIVTLADGHELQAERRDVPGFGSRAMNRRDVENKWKANVAGVMNERDISRLLEVIWNLDTEKDLSGFGKRMSALD